LEGNAIRKSLRHRDLALAQAGDPLTISKV
jgi:hypothetical protein